MGRFILTSLVVLCLCAGAHVGLATVSLGGWNEGDPGTTHELWDFTPGYVAVSGSGYTATPEVVYNPEPSLVSATITPIGGGGWDGVSSITGDDGIYVNLEISNYDNLNEYKEIWVDLGGMTVSGVAVSATDGGSTTFQYTVLPGQGEATFGIKIVPNPNVEKISFLVTSPTGGAAVLDYIDVDTICAPEPLTLAMFGLGALVLRRRK